MSNALDMGKVTREVATAWRRLAGVLDPEVPVLSIVELGMVRAVSADARGVAVTITPTYAGCPAMEAIVADIEQALGVDGQAVRVHTTLAPAWSTDWIAPEARERLRQYGVAPPHVTADVARDRVQAGAGESVNVTGISPLRHRKAAVACPRCGSTHTSLIAQFGSTACKALYRCVDCDEPFDYMKSH